MRKPRDQREKPPLVQVPLTWAEWDELDAFVKAKGAKKGATAARALMALIRAERETA